ncbi:phenylalanine--tRNA ligase subunit alpha [Candidatus Latescibacterota bacterium]
MLEEIEDLKQRALAEIAAAGDDRSLEDLRVQYLGRRSRLRQILSGIGDLPAAERPAAGQSAGGAQKAISSALTDRLQSLSEALEAGQAIDVTLPGRRRPEGKLHPLTRTSEELVGLLQGMGFTVAEGPEVEDEYHNFDALNTPSDHPARDLHDTFYLEDGRLLRTHTSTVQIRVMETTPPPLRVICLGRCYRRDTVDATHHYVFHQIEGLSVDVGVTLADLKGALMAIGRGVLGEGTRIRLRPHFFPFTEPSVEYDFSCSLCGGAGSRGQGATCRVCKGTGWIEIGGAGMVDPNVFEAVGYDAETYTGFAFGLGIERIAMMRHGIDDIRLFLDSDLRFVRQF